jgi:hypothetical protein
VVHRITFATLDQPGPDDEGDPGPNLDCGTAGVLWSTKGSHSEGPEEDERGRGLLTTE